MKDQSPKKIALVGGDLRQLETAKALAEADFDVTVYGMDIVGDLPALSGLKKAATLKEALNGSHILILPLPYSYDGEKINAPLATRAITLAELFAYLSPNTKIAAGLLGRHLPEQFLVFDYSESEPFAIKNARATVEGALAIAIRESPAILCKSHCVVTGYGRIGKMLASSLSALGARVSVVACSAKDRAWAFSEGLCAHSFDALPTLAPTTDFLFNTVPSSVIGKNTLSALPSDTTVIELASLPGGIDLRAADELGVRVITALGLPGKYSPKSAGRIIADCVRDAFGL